MIDPRRWTLPSALVLGGLLAVGCTDGQALRDPSPDALAEPAPDSFAVRFETSAGDFTRRFLIPRTEDEVMRVLFSSLAQHQLGQFSEARGLLSDADKSYEFLSKASQSRLRNLRAEVRVTVRG